MNHNMMIFNVEEFEKEISKIREASKNIKNVFERENENIETINNTEIWYGNTNQVFYEKYIALKNNYDGIENSLNNIVKFLEGVLNSYKETENSIDKNINMMDDSLNINS